MSKTIQIYVKNTSNCEGMPLTTFEQLSPEWESESLHLPFGEGDKTQKFTVVGWTDLHFGSPCNVYVARVRHGENKGFLVWGGNSGVRILDDDIEPVNHLPAGYGRPIVWVEEVTDLPREVRAVVTRSLCEGCKAELPLSTSPYYLDEGQSAWLCEECATND